jgi:hypothetical protein
MSKNIRIIVAAALIILAVSGCRKDFYFPDAKRSGFIVGQYPEGEWTVSESRPDSLFSTQDLDLDGDSLADVQVSVFGGTNSQGLRVYSASIRIHNEEISLSTVSMIEEYYVCIDTTVSPHRRVSYTDSTFYRCPAGCPYYTGARQAEYIAGYEPGDTIYFDSNWFSTLRRSFGSSTYGSYYEGIIGSIEYLYEYESGSRFWNGQKSIAFRQKNSSGIRFGVVEIELIREEGSKWIIHSIALMKNYLTR